MDQDEIVEVLDASTTYTRDEIETIANSLMTTSLDMGLRHALFEIAGTCCDSASTVLQRLADGSYGRKDPVFSRAKSRQMESDEFTKLSLEVEDGVLTCPKCKGKKTLTSQKQTRSADEPMTTFAHCVSCKHQWVYTG